MARVVDTDVKAVLLQHYDVENNPSLTPFITVANSVTDRVQTGASSRGIVLSTQELINIECWLSAHFYVMSDENYTSRETGDAKGMFAGKTGMGLEASKFGQTAMTLDPSGYLRVLNSGKRLQFNWSGFMDQDRLSFVDRNGE